MSDERKNVIASAIAERFLRNEFRPMSNSDYRRKLGSAAQELGYSITAEELHEFILNMLPKTIGSMFGWLECSITGSAITSPKKNN